MNKLEALIRQLPPELQQEVADFVDFFAAEARTEGGQAIVSGLGGYVEGVS
jgi:hypothetical protein